MPEPDTKYAGFNYTLNAVLEVQVPVHGHGRVHRQYSEILLTLRAQSHFSAFMAGDTTCQYKWKEVNVRRDVPILHMSISVLENTYNNDAGNDSTLLPFPGRHGTLCQPATLRNR
ncbi:MAG: hypothetical protein R2727_07335 [Bacteroidales bacterium]